MTPWFWSEWQMPPREVERLTARNVDQFLNASQRRKQT
jgi:hypothetical protein